MYSVNSVAKKMSFLFFLAKRFIAGRDWPEALKVVRSIHAQGFLTTIDHLGEHVPKKEQAKKAAEYYSKVIKSLKNENLDKNISVKLTQLGLEIDRDFCRENLKLILEEAREIGGFVRVDIEGSDTTSSAFSMIKELRDLGYPIGAAVQSMLRRTPSDVVSLLENGVAIRLCKGAYKEPVDIAYQHKWEVNRQFIALMKRLLTSGSYHAIATHDEKIIEATKTFAKERRISPSQFEFQMLLGIRRPMQKKLLKEGFRVRIYIPFGHTWLPYVIRRLRERKENLWFVIKHLFRR